MNQESINKIYPQIIQVQGYVEVEENNQYIYIEEIEGLARGCNTPSFK